MHADGQGEWTCPTCARSVAATPYCAACGERRLGSHDRSIAGLLEQWVETVFHVDGRLGKTLLSIWRREYRSGTLGAPINTPEAGGGFVPLVMESALPEPAERPSREADDARIDITLTNGRRMTIPVLLAPSHLAALLAVLDP